MRAIDRLNELRDRISKTRRQDPDKVMKVKREVYPDLIRAKREVDGFDPEKFRKMRIKVKTVRIDNAPYAADIVGIIEEKNMENKWVSEDVFFREYVTKEGRYWSMGNHIGTLTELKNLVRERLTVIYEKRVQSTPAEYYCDIHLGEEN